MERLQGVEGVRPTAFTTGYTYHKMKTIVQEFVAEALRTDGHVLDIGCGRGYDLLRLSERYGHLNLRMYGLDVSLADLRVASTRAKDAKHSSSFGLLTSLAENLPFRDNTFDALICSEVVEHLPNPDLALKEMFRVMRPGGVLTLTTPNVGNKLHRLRKFLPRSLKATADEWRELQTRINSERRSAEGVNLPHISELSAREWCAKCRMAGFNVVEVRRGSLLYGDPFLEGRPAIWALSLLFDRFLDRVSDDWSWQVLIKARKKSQPFGSPPG